MILNKYAIQDCLSRGKEKTGSWIDVLPANANRSLSPDDFADQIGPNSIDTRLGTRILQANQGILDVDEYLRIDSYDLELGEKFLLVPGELYLASTLEYFECSNDMVMMLEGRSTCARYGITCHQSAGFGDIGFRGSWTLELSCIRPVWIKVGMRIAQVSFHKTFGPELEEAELYLANGSYADSCFPKLPKPGNF